MLLFPDKIGNIYNLHISGSEQSHPIASIFFHTDRTSVSNNYALLHLHNSQQFMRNLDHIKSYVNDKFAGLQTQLLIGVPCANGIRMGMKAMDVRELEKRGLIPGETGTIMIRSNCNDTRKVIDVLFQNQDMSATDRADIEPVLCELEKSAAFSGQCIESITKAQKDIIQSVVSPYLDDIKAVVSDRKNAENLLERATTVVEMYGQNANNHLSNVLSDYIVKDQTFWDCFLAVAKFYAGMGDLEGALAQSGQSLPSKKMVRQAILELFEIKEVKLVTAEKPACATCKATDKKTYLCACKNIRYCGKACQTIDWSKHKLVCQSLTSTKNA